MAVNAYMLINAKLGLTEATIRELTKLKGVKSADRVAGPYDVVAYIEVPELSDLTNFIKKVPHDIEIQQTTTLIVLPKPNY